MPGSPSTRSPRGRVPAGAVRGGDPAPGSGRAPDAAGAAGGPGPVRRGASSARSIPPLHPAPSETLPVPAATPGAVRPGPRPGGVARGGSGGPRGPTARNRGQVTGGGMRPTRAVHGPPGRPARSPHRASPQAAHPADLGRPPPACGQWGPKPPHRSRTRRRPRSPWGRGRRGLRRRDVGSHTRGERVSRAGPGGRVGAVERVRWVPCGRWSARSELSPGGTRP